MKIVKQAEESVSEREPNEEIKYEIDTNVPISLGENGSGTVLLGR